MKPLVVIFLLCSVSAHADPDLSGMLKLTNGSNLAHACPIAMDKALTNRHVARDGSQWVWGTGDGEANHGLAEVDGSPDTFRDLASIKPITDARFPKWYPLATTAPKTGERVWFLGYDWSNAKDGFGPDVVEAKVVRLLNGHLIFKSAGRPGSSGSCILNESGEVVAINQGGKDMDDKAEDGVGVGVWGNWLQLKPEEPPAEEPTTFPFPFFQIGPNQ